MRPPGFLIVGTPRSGTTLVQRLACELEGVRVPPETHFFTDFAWSLSERWQLPLCDAVLQDALRDYSRRPYMSALDFDVDAVVDGLRGRCDSMLDLFGAIVTHLAGRGSIVGEKTPGHLLWWRALTCALPDLKLVCVVRDPRAVVASQLQVGWSRHHVMTAQRWRDDVVRVREASATLGPDRCLVLRFEDVVASEERARSTLAAFLGAEPAADLPPRSHALFAPWERWKAAALEPADPSRSDAWRSVLERRQVLDIEATCHAAMALTEYGPSMGRASARARRSMLPPGAQARRLQHRLRRYRREHGIAQIADGWRAPAPASRPLDQGSRYRGDR